MFLQQELAGNFSLPACRNKAELLEKLSAEVDQLISKDFPKLISVLYQLDVNEGKLRQTLKENTGTNAGKLIAELILERQIQKLESRRSAGSKQDIPDDEKW